MNAIMNRRIFGKTLAGAAAAAVLPVSAAERKLKIGHTCITWGTFPRSPEAMATLGAAVPDIARLGYWSFETFPEVLEDWDARGALRKLMDENNLPLKSGYCGTILTDPSKRKESVEKVIRLGKMIQKYGGTFAVIAPNGVKRAQYNYKEYRESIIAGLNDHAMALTDLGLGTGLHQHTGTCIESRDEVYDVMHSANTRYLKFAPDVGQLQKGGADAAQVIEDFLPLVKHMHLKDYSGGEHFAGYCPLGMGKVDLVRVLDLVEKGGQQPNIMVELDSSPNQPIPALECATISKKFLQKQGYKFRS
ncbi:MAG TPA: sugar phosphate isomerase/epimerase [Bryobacteraceae bacterium]|nr:sugar phosphate isomerase/epimerase [Bryobacteraceae bacterium]